jgi:outer membrane autotransporter protein
MKQNTSLGLRSLLAAAALLTFATPAGRAAELNYTVDDLGPSRYIVDLYTANDIGLGAGTWSFGLRPLVEPVLNTSLTGVIQTGSINFLNFRNGALVSAVTGASASIAATVYQDGVSINALVGVSTTIFPSPVGAVIIPNVQVRTEGLGSQLASWNLYNPNSYDAVLSLTNTTLDGTPGRDAIHADAFVDATLNLAGVNRINGATLVNAINLNSGSTTFNGNVAGFTNINGSGLTLTYTGLASQISGTINSSSALNVTTLNLMGGNSLNDSVNLFRFSGSTINISGSNVVFNGALVETSNVRFTTGGSLGLANGVYLDADVDFAGNNATLTVGNESDVSGSILTSGQQSGTIVFSGNSVVADNVGGSGSFRAIDYNGGSTSAAVVNGYTQANAVNLNAAGTAGFGTGLDTRLVDNTLGTVRYFNTDGKVQVGFVDVTGLARSSTVFANFVTDTNNNGVLTFVGGTQDVTGQVGAVGKSLRLLNIGAVNAGLGLDLGSNSTSFTTIDGDVYAQTVLFSSGVNQSSLTMASGHNLVGTTLATDENGRGRLILAGGAQAATFTTIGSAVTRLGEVQSGFAGGVSTITGDSFLFSGYTDSGRTDFSNSLNALVYDVASGTANFNVVGGSTTFQALRFFGAGTANFNQGFTTSTVDFGSNAATVNIAAGKDLVGDVLAVFSHGTIDFAGGTSVLNGTVAGISQLTVGSASQGALTVTGNLAAATTTLANGSTLDARASIAGNIVTTTDGTGALVLTNGDQTVFGNIGTAAASLASATVGANGTTTSFNGSAPSGAMSHVDQVTFAGDGTLVLNGVNGGAAASGLVGAVDFTSGGEGTLAIGSGVNLTFGAGGISLQNANLATLDFLGDSTVVGQVGAPAGGLVLAGSTPGDIRAGANGTTVNFGGPVYVSGTTFHVVGTGTVNFADDLFGPLVYEADGTVNFADTKRVVGVVTTTNDVQGVLNYLGSTTLAGSIGTAVDRLREVKFHTDSTQASSAQSLGYDIFSVDTVIGNTGVVSGNQTTTVATLTSNIHLGTFVFLADASTTLYSSGAQTLVGGTSVDFVHTKNANGTLTLGTISRSTFGRVLDANSGTLGFAVAATPFTTLAGANGLVDGASSSLLSGIEGLAGSFLNMTGNETIQVSFLGSLRNNVSATVVDVDGGATGAQAGTLLDNSFVIDTTMSRVNGDLVITTSRNALTYVTKSASLGSRSDDMAIRLGTLAAAGTGYSASLATVFNKLDLDQWGYGNNAANLARQLQLLTPAGDGAAVQASFGLTAQAIGTVLDASADLTTKHASGNNYWVRGFGGRLSRDNAGEYASFSANLGGAVVGTDRLFGDAVVGLAVGYGMASVSSDGPRAGDEADVRSTIAGLYARFPVGKFFLNAMVNTAQHRTESNRQAAVGERAQGDYDGSEIGGTLQFGRRFALATEGFSVTPILALDYAKYEQDAYAETGAGDIGLRYAEQDYAQSSASLMVRVSKETKLGEGMASSWNAYLGYRRLLSTPTYDNTVSFIGDTESFFVGGWSDPAKGSLTGGLSYDYNPRSGVTYSLRYDMETKSNFNIHSVGFRATWAY